MLSQIIEGRESLELEDVLSMEGSLVQLALTCYPGCDRKVRSVRNESVIV